MTDNDETAPVPRFSEGTVGGSAPLPAEAGSAPAPLPQDGTAPQYGSAPQCGQVPATGAARPGPNRRTLAIVAVAIGGVLLVGSGFGAGFVVGHATARSAGHGVLVSRFDQRGAMPGPGYAQGRGGQARPFGGQGVIPRHVVPSPASPVPAPTS